MTSPLKEIRALDELKASVALHCGIGDPQASCACGNYALAAQQEAQRQICDFVTIEAARQQREGVRGKCSLRSERLDKRLHRSVHRFASRARVHEIDANGRRVGFVPIIAFLAGSLISWLVGKALDFLWQWFSRASAVALATVCSQAVETSSLSRMDSDDAGA